MQPDGLSCVKAGNALYGWSACCALVDHCVKTFSLDPNTLGLRQGKLKVRLFDAAQAVFAETQFDVQDRWLAGA